MNCPECGAAVAEKAVFCQQCGHRLDTAGGLHGTEVDPREHLAKGSPPSAAPYPEEDLWNGAYSPQAMLGTWVMAGLISLGLLVIALFVGRGEHARSVWLTVLSAIALLFLSAAGVLLYRRANVQYRLTNQRLFYLSGVLKRRTDLIELINVNDVGFEQGPIERLVTHTGTIRVYSKDQSHPKLFLTGIAEVEKVVDILDNARRAERRRRGLQMLGGELKADAPDSGHFS